MGFYYEENRIDWIIADFDYQGKTGSNKWSCRDAFSGDVASIFRYTQDDESNCVIDTEDCVAKFGEDSIAYLKAHWMRPLKTGDTSDDLELFLDEEK